ncbi:AAA family ATPase [Streptomyces sp. NPDC090445]|uniref:AAA family ATPase n=1 Tax=Streptomyces sp. NPDC090445 TaxID=3365963 RepID=UPI003802C1CD
MTETAQPQHPEHPLVETVAARLAGAALPEPVKELLHTVLDSGSTTAAADDCPSGRVYLDSLSVNGFRGIGPRAHLKLSPRPGVSLVVGRNGSGKSSLADAAEVAFTGAKAHRHGQGATRGGSWRNLHDGGSPRIEVKLAIEGDTNRSTLTRSWSSEEFAASEATFKRPGHGTVSLSEAGWGAALADYRPFLSYVDLDNMISGKPSQRYDTIATILGMGQLSTAHSRLKEQEKILITAEKEVKEALPGLKEALYSLENDDRSVQALVAVDTSGTPDFGIIDGLVAGLPPADGGVLAELRIEAEVQAPDVEKVDEAVHRLRLALADVDDVRGTDAESARLRADLLEKALAHSVRQPDDDICPACGTERAIGPDWYERASHQVTELRREAKTAEDAHDAVRSAARILRNLADRPGRPPRALAGPWEAWASCREITEPVELAGRAEEAAKTLTTACAMVKDRAVKELERRDERWRLLVTRLAAWTEKARDVERNKPRLRDLRKALTWLKSLSAELRARRMERFTNASQRIWESLRQESNVDLTAVSLEGGEKATVRKLVMDASVDGKSASALDVMSQGEQHSLALSLFLPRATTADSPFGFLVIDDPVQSMDPAKVHGLAQVLNEMGRHRQVVVFTHDTRLQKAFTSQELPVSVFQVERAQESRVKVTQVNDPVAQAVADARAIASTPDLPAAAHSHVLPSLCRIALEHALLEAAWIRHHRSGGSEQDLQNAVGDAERFRKVAALALFGDVRRVADVDSEVRRRYGDQAVRLVRQCQNGAHPGGVQISDAHRFVSDVEALAQKVRKPEVGV